jgi:hypothetical protein
MAMDAARQPAQGTGRIEELARENQALREQLRQYAAAQSVARGAIVEAVSEKEAAARIAHQVAVEERATRTAVEVQSHNLSFSVWMQLINFFLLLILAIGLFAWLPQQIADRMPHAVVAPAAPGTVVIPGR